MDFLPTLVSGQDSDSSIHDFLQQFYGIGIDAHTWYGLNLHWPRFDLPTNQDRYFVSWHTEYIDRDWMFQQVSRLQGKPVVLVTDYPLHRHSAWPDNVLSVTQVTMHHQFEQLKQRYGIQVNPEPPAFLLSSLSNRVSQFKRYVTAYLLDRVDHHKLILTWNATVMKPEDLHAGPEGSWLDRLPCPQQAIKLNWPDSDPASTPLDNGDWRKAPYLDALVNLTNESYHYSLTSWQDRDCVNPGPYLTEKTWKPLCAGRPFLPVAQSGVVSWLSKFGFRFDFGFDLSFDSDTGDMSRMASMLRTVDAINQQTITELFEFSLDSVRHNAALIDTGELWHSCQNHNNETKHLLQ